MSSVKCYDKMIGIITSGIHYSVTGIINYVKRLYNYIMGVDVNSHSEDITCGSRPPYFLRIRKLINYNEEYSSEDSDF